MKRLRRFSRIALSTPRRKMSCMDSLRLMRVSSMTSENTGTAALLYLGLPMRNLKSSKVPERSMPTRKGSGDCITETWYLKLASRFCTPLIARVYLSTLSTKGKISILLSEIRPSTDMRSIWPPVLSLNMSLRAICSNAVLSERVRSSPLMRITPLIEGVIMFMAVSRSAVADTTQLRLPRNDFSIDITESTAGIISITFSAVMSLSSRSKPVLRSCLVRVE